ncbi:MAG TPA: hypothetical protein VF103_19115 [Polyangiaceae bacterium]
MPGVWVRSVKARSLTLVAALTFVACGGGGEAEPYVPVRSDVQKQCDSLMAVWCESSVECVASGFEPGDELTDSELSYQRTLCNDVAKRTCDATIEVNDGYDQCRSSVETLDEADCEAVREAVSSEGDVAMPASCASIFVTD